ncbi:MULTISPECIES: hypothetical protein [unclassified Sporosarcina]|uniref:hypothetical protein n=1 Tax=unclassified Sporosarcina TaxID=2647733 RepID=UPI001A935540|nr:MULTISPECIES: hypothetical protein [unclassified Sporosarcina]MBO0587616.1 hypothetical protein [Sporosarcina sp. E16_8]MBO0602394.1 hypothetical protein [Sporosarcina sp. E16_3]
MASTAQEIIVFAGLYDHLITLQTNQNGSTVDVSIAVKQQGGGHGQSANTNWTMYLERAINDAWIPIGTRTGYTSNTSPSNRDFPNIPKEDNPLRIRMVYKGFNPNTNKPQDYHQNSKVWIR